MWRRKWCLKKTELGRYPGVRRQNAREEEPVLQSLGLYWRERGEKKDKDKNKCLMPSKDGASVKQSVHRAV